MEGRIRFHFGGSNNSSYYIEMDYCTYRKNILIGSSKCKDCKFYINEYVDYDKDIVYVSCFKEIVDNK